MSLAYDVASAVQNVDYTGTATISWTHTPSGTPKVVTVNVQWCAIPSDPAGNNISGITYNGVAMTQVGTQTIGGLQVQEKWILLAPPSGAQTVALTWGGAGLTRGRATSTTFTAAATVTYGTLQTATGASSPITKVVSSVASTSILDTIGGCNDVALAAITITVNGTSETKRSGVTTYGTAAEIDRGQFYTSTQTGTGTVTANATESASRAWGIMVLELQEVATITGGPLMMMMGIGM